MPEFILSITKEKAANMISEEFEDKQIQLFENDDGDISLKIRSRAGDYEGEIYDYESDNVGSGSFISILEDSLYLKEPIDQYVI